MRRFDESGISMKLGERGGEIRPKILCDGSGKYEGNNSDIAQGNTS
jgi:hypothetical protein